MIGKGALGAKTNVLKNRVIDIANTQVNAGKNAEISGAGLGRLTVLPAGFCQIIR
jgi:hypothetical protein